jgi:tight adherence protein C
MIDLVAENSVLRLLLLLLLFALVAAVAYLLVQGFSAKQFAKRRLVEAAGPSSATAAAGSLRAERIESAWLKLVNSIEGKGLSLVDTKDVSLRHKLIAAGFAATYAPRVYTLIRLVLVVALPLLVLTFFWLTG